MDLIIIDNIVSTIQPTKLELFLKFFKAERKAKFTRLFDANDCGVLVQICDFIIATNARCVREFGFSIRREIEMEFNQAIVKRIKQET